MRKILCLFYLLLILCPVFTQNYETIKPDIPAHFGNYIHSIQTDSTTYSGDTTFYHNFPMIRTSFEECEYIFGASWTGYSIIILPNGYNLFVNKNLCEVK